MSDHDDLIPLTYVARALKDAGLTLKPVDYNRIYRGVLSAEFPAEQEQTNRWSIRRANLPKVAAALGLIAPSDNPQPKSHNDVETIAA